jgi:hypothetical protein
MSRTRRLHETKSLFDAVSPRAAALYSQISVKNPNDTLMEDWNDHVHISGKQKMKLKIQELTSRMNKPNGNRLIDYE